MGQASSNTSDGTPEIVPFSKIPVDPYDEQGDVESAKVKDLKSS